MLGVRRTLQANSEIWVTEVHLFNLNLTKSLYLLGFRYIQRVTMAKPTFTIYYAMFRYCTNSNSAGHILSV